MRNFARNVMSDMSFRNSMCYSRTDPTHERAEVTKQVTIKSGQGSPSERELLGTVVRHQRVSVLQKGDEHKPVIRPGENYRKRESQG
jgi:hypothetical protein